MKTRIIELRELQADEGMVLTNGETFSDVGGPIYLGALDNINNWYEITEAEAEEIKAKEATDYGHFENQR